MAKRTSANAGQQSERPAQPPTAKPATPRQGRPQRLAHRRGGNDRNESGATTPDVTHVPPKDFPSQQSAKATPQPAASYPGPAAAGVLCLPNPEWLPHILTVTGPAGTLASFRQAAAGPGRIPWQPDAERWEEDWVHKLLAPAPAARGISLPGARIAARQLREALELLEGRLRDDPRHQRCPLDLHVLIPIPAQLLAQGPEAPVTLAWFWEHWGTTWPLRRVEEIAVARAGVSVAANHEALCVRFFSADWTPWRAVAALRLRWPELTFSIEILAVTA